MPVTLNSETDATLLLAIMKTHDIRVETAKVVAAWPANKEAPTARAVQKRILKLRKAAARDSTITNTPRKSAPSSPLTPRANGTAATMGSTGGKRKRSIKKDDDDDDSDTEAAASDMDDDTLAIREAKRIAGDLLDGDGSPKRARRSVSMKLPKYVDGDEEEIVGMKGESDQSEFETEWTGLEGIGT